MQVSVSYKALGTSLLVTVVCWHIVTCTSRAAFIGHHVTRLPICRIDQTGWFHWCCTCNQFWETMFDNWMGLLLCLSCNSLQIKIANHHCNQFHWGRVCCSSTCSQDSQIPTLCAKGSWIHSRTSYSSLWRQSGCDHYDQPMQTHHTFQAHWCPVLCNTGMVSTGWHSHEAHCWYSEYGRWFDQSPWLDLASLACPSSNGTSLSFCMQFFVELKTISVWTQGGCYHMYSHVREQDT